MTASILDGKHVANIIQSNLKQKLAMRALQNLRVPTLAVVRVGDDPASIIYVNHKIKACKAVGFISLSYELDKNTSQAKLLNLINTLNQDPKVDGILVQLPLPEQIDTRLIIEQLSPNKDVDGFHPYNLGRLAQGNPSLRPCTPYGIIQLLNYYQLEVKGLDAVVVGASNIVGRPMAYELLLAGATVTICNRSTQKLEDHIRRAGLLVIATGHYDAVKTDWLQSNQIVIDVGMHRTENGSVHGDIDFSVAQNKVAWITPVPGGVGPMTISTLLQNTLAAAELA